jgi:hypothetical protein
MKQPSPNVEQLRAMREARCADAKTIPLLAEETPPEVAPAPKRTKAKVKNGEANADPFTKVCAAYTDGDTVAPIPVIVKMLREGVALV